MIRAFWNKINGKKTLTGVVITGIGIAMYNVPFLAPAADAVLYAGLTMLGIGGTHKLIKAKGGK